MGGRQRIIFTFDLIFLGQYSMPRGPAFSEQYFVHSYLILGEFSLYRIHVFVQDCVNITLTITFRIFSICTILVLHHRHSVLTLHLFHMYVLHIILCTSTWLSQRDINTVLRPSSVNNVILLMIAFRGWSVCPK